MNAINEVAMNTDVKMYFYKGAMSTVVKFATFDLVFLLKLVILGLHKVCNGHLKEF